MPNKKGQARIAIATTLDISEQKKTEAHYDDEIQLWNENTHNSLMSFIINISSNIVLNENGNLLDIEIENRNAQNLLDLFASKIANKEGKKAYSKLFTIKKLIKYFNVATRSQSLQLLLLFGEKSMWVSFSIAMIKDTKHGDIIGFISINDITEEKIAQDFAQEFVTNQFDLILRVNYEADIYQAFYAPNVYKDFKDLSFTGKYSTDIITILTAATVKEDLPTLVEEFTIKRLLERSANGEKYTFYARIKRNGQSNRFKNFRIFQRNDITKNICIGCIDITDMYQEEQERVETLREALTVARQANTYKTTFLASMSHDIRTPMNAIMGMTDLAIEDQNNPTQIAESLSVIKSSSEHLLALLNDILEMNRLENGNITFVEEVFSLTHACSEVYNTFKGIALQKKQIMKFKCINIEHDRVISDRTRLNRVLTNLLGNAVKFTPNGGTITMRLEELKKQNDKIVVFRITIQDSGIGIATEYLESIFEAFNREENLAVNGIEGTGLGLAIVKAIIESQGGIISVESEKDYGSIFTIEIPLRTADTSVTIEENTCFQSMKMTDVDLKSKHFLLVEDHPINVLVASKILTKMGAIVVTALNGEEGYNTFYNNPAGTFELIFMDLQMPIMDGYEATSAIRNSDHPEAKTIPIVAMTANAFAEDIIKCKNSGMNCHVAKPINVENIVDCLMGLQIL